MTKRLCIAIFLMLSLTCQKIDAAQIVIQESPVRIISSTNRDIFPKSWLSVGINAESEMLQESEIERSRKILNKAIEKYPKRVILSNLDNIYILHRLKYNGISAAGTNSRKSVYLANPGNRDGYTDNAIEGTFHAEFSSILLRNFPQFLDKDAWENANSVSFKYGGSAVQAIKQKKSRTSFNVSLHAEGFLHEYAKSTMENDFNSIAAQLFLGKGSFWSVVDNYKRISKKTDLVIAFFHEIDPTFSKTFFLSLVVAR